MNIRDRVEAYFYGDIYHRDGDFLSVAAEVLNMTQQQVDEEIDRERTEMSGKTREILGCP